MEDGGDGVDSGDSAEDGDSCDASDPLLMSPSRLASNCLNSASARSSRVNVRGCDGGAPEFSGAGCVLSDEEIICGSVLEEGEDELHHQPILCKRILDVGKSGQELEVEVAPVLKRQLCRN